MRTIPEIRARMHQLAIEHSLPELAQLAEETKRRSPARRGRTKRAVVTAELAAAVRAFFAAYPNAHYDEIAEKFNLNPGRVSEIVNGKR